MVVISVCSYIIVAQILSYLSMFSRQQEKMEYMIYNLKQQSLCE